MHEADESYMGYLGAAELILLLNALLEAERAVARVALAIADEAKTGPIAALMQALHAEEARCCAMLTSTSRGWAAWRRTRPARSTTRRWPL